MNYYVAVTAPPLTPLTSPIEVEIKLTVGTIRYCSIYFPPGSGGLLKVQLWLNASQLIPWHRGQWLRGDDLLVPDYGSYPVIEDPLLLLVRAYSDATLYDHTAYVGVELSPLTQVYLAPPGALPGAGAGA